MTADDSDRGVTRSRKLYERKKPAPKVKITEVPSANQEIKPDSADKTEKKSGAKIDVLVDD